MPWFQILAILLLTAHPALAESVAGRRIFVEFAFDPTTAEMAAAERHGAELFAKAKAARRPVTVRAARSDSTTLLSLESVAICERAKGCPLLVFRDITKAPVLQRSAFQNLILEYREAATFLILRVWDTTTECRISNVTKAVCHDLPGRK
jgi:hypothetical protein